MRTFREDEYHKRKDHSAENFAVLWHITLNLLKQEKTCKRSIAGKRLLAGWDVNYLLLFENITFIESLVLDSFIITTYH